MTNFIIGFFVGGTIGFLAAAILCAAKKADEMAQDLTRNF